MKPKRLLSALIAAAMIAGTMPVTVFAGRLDYEPEETEPGQVTEAEEEKPSKPVEKETEPEAKETEAPKETEPAEKEPETEAPKEAEEPETAAPEAKENDAEAENSAEQEPEKPVTVKANKSADFIKSQVKFSNGILSWNAIDGAAKYRLILSGTSEEVYTTACSYDVGKWIDGLIVNRDIYKSDGYDAMIFAYDADDSRLSCIDITFKYVSKAEPATKLPEITNLKISSDGILTWDEYKNNGNNFSGYDIRIIGEQTLVDHVYLPEHSFDLKKILEENISYGFKVLPSYKIQVIATEAATWKPIAESGYITYNYKKANTLKVKVKKNPKFKAKAVKKKTQSIKLSKVLKVTYGKGTVTYAKAAGNTKIYIKSKKLFVKKKLKKGTYTIQIKVKAAGNSIYAPVEKTVKVKVKVK